MLVLVPLVGNDLNFTLLTQVGGLKVIFWFWTNLDLVQTPLQIAFDPDEGWTPPVDADKKLPHFPGEVVKVIGNYILSIFHAI